MSVAGVAASKKAIVFSPRERVRRALAGEPVDILPAAPAYLSLFLADFERAYYVEQYRRRLRGRTRYPVNHEEDTLLRAQAIYQSYGIFKARPDWMEIHQGAGRTWAGRTAIVQENGILYYEDQGSGKRLPMLNVPMPWGDVVREVSASRSDTWDLSAQIQGTKDVDRLLPIAPAEELLVRGDLDLPRQVVADYGEYYWLSTILDTPFSDAYDLLGFQGLMLIQHDRPDLLHYLLQRKLEQTKEAMRAWSIVGVHGVYVEEVFTGADMISPHSFEHLVCKYNQPYFEHMRSLGLVPIYYICGDSVPRLERIAQFDVAAIGVEESKKNFSIELADVVDRLAGRCAALGNIDAVRFGLQATAEEMAAEVRRQAEIGARARGFIVSTGSPFPLDTNPRQIDALVAAAHAVEGR